MKGGTIASCRILRREMGKLIRLWGVGEVVVSRLSFRISAVIPHLSRHPRESGDPAVREREGSMAYTGTRPADRWIPAFAGMTVVERPPRNLPASRALFRP